MMAVGQLACFHACYQRPLDYLILQHYDIWRTRMTVAPETCSYSKTLESCASIYYILSFIREWNNLEISVSNLVSQSKLKLALLSYANETNVVPKHLLCGSRKLNVKQ